MLRIVIEIQLLRFSYHICTALRALSTIALAEARVLRLLPHSAYERQI